MKKTFLPLFVLFCVSFFALPAFAMKNEPDGFRGIPWGTAPPTIEEEINRVYGTSGTNKGDLGLYILFDVL